MGYERNHDKRYHCKGVNIKSNVSRNHQKEEYYVECGK